ncbi:acyl-homoserine-lactone synthase [Methylobacterium trifolii]|uniref:Acyl-homoserine-lactone synthase n=1 Tax=Methylobacterium trifolii TaxID=1003092 RepID=A0ABQ4TS01_9HYPH|nr:acyl-homoserine-lactone synthase [Methylobacterium trifolii]GJE58124.1 4-coumaroyl-homoserine lactone synthase [Methylobacterium trifolii]
MVFVVDDSNIAEHGAVMEKVYLFRHKLFVERLKWEECRKADGREIDQFDGAGCVHLVRMDGGEVTAYTRLLPTTKPHLLTDVYPHLAQNGPAPRGPRVYEWTRCGTLPSRREGRAGIIDPATAEIFTAAAEVARERGWDGLLAQTHPILVNRLMSCGWDVEPLGLPTKYLGHSIVAVFARLKPETVETSRRFFGLGRSPIERVEVDAGPGLDIEIRLRA